MPAILSSRAVSNGDQSDATWHRVDQFDVSLCDGEAAIYVTKDIERCIAVGITRKVKHVLGVKTVRLVCIDGDNQSIL